MVSLDVFLAPVPSPSPSGIDLRNDGRFHELDRLLLPATRAARAQTPDSDPAVSWDEVMRLCEELAADGRDLRLLVIVVRALAQSDGFLGVASGLELLTQTIETYWPSLHPELRDRPSPREAAVRRVNALYQLENLDDGLLCDLVHMAFITQRPFGRITGADLAAGSLSRTAYLNEIPGLSESEKSAMGAQHEARSGRVRTACRALAAEDPGRLAELVEGVTAARKALGTLEDRLSARVAENGMGVSLAHLSRFLERVGTTLAQAAQDTSSQPQPAAAGTAPAAGPETASAPIGTIASRQDVERMLDRIIEFYDRTEPASPIPLLARRLRRMVPMTFLQLMEEMAPSGLKEVRNLAGALDDKSRPKGGADGG